MRQLSETLLAAQRQAAAVPYVGLEAASEIAGVPRYAWSRLYSGTESGYCHSLTFPADGSMLRVRVAPPAEARKLYLQRVAAPGPDSNFSQWDYTGRYNVLAVAVASLGAEVSVVWINLGREVRRFLSQDYGVSWGSAELLDYLPGITGCGIAAAYEPGGDLALFCAGLGTLYVKKCLGGVWQTKSAWDKSAGDLSGVTAIYDGDWELMVTGQDTSGNYKLWSLVYGDGGEVTAGEWSDLKELASAPAGGAFQFAQPFLYKPDFYRCFFVEKFSGTGASDRVFWSHSVPGASFAESLWREPVPFNYESAYGLAPAHYGGSGWLSGPAGVWQTASSAQSLDLTADVISVRQEQAETGGGLTVTLRNDDGRYAAPGQGDLAVLVPGCQLEFAPGYVTPAGAESGPGQTYQLEAWEHTSAAGESALVLHARDAWEALGGWRARHQFRWNKTAEEMSVTELLAFVLARVGLKLEVVPRWEAAAGFYPDFTIGAGSRGQAVLRKLLSFVPDVVFIEGQQAYLVNPLATDGSVYSYGGLHPVMEGSYRRGAWGLSRVQVGGEDEDGVVLAESFAWDEIDRLYDRFGQVEDGNLGDAAAAQQRGEACLRKAEIAASAGSILVPVNCGQQLYDVIDVTDGRAGLSAAGWRVLGLSLVYNPRRGEYRQRLRLGAV